jgi:hypothetical protein
VAQATALEEQNQLLSTSLDVAIQANRLTLQANKIALDAIQVQERIALMLEIIAARWNGEVKVDGNGEVDGG